MGISKIVLVGKVKASADDFVLEMSRAMIDPMEYQRLGAEMIRKG